MGRRRTLNNPGPPAWFVFLTTVALILGGYYLWLGGRDYVRTGGLGVVEATERAVLLSTETAEFIALVSTPTTTPRPSFTPVPECQAFTVTVSAAVVRLQPDTNSPQVDVFEQNEEVCVVERVLETEWYLIDVRPETTRLDEGYMRDDIIQALNPTSTPTTSPTALPTVTPTETETPTPTLTIDPNASSTPTRTEAPPSQTPSPSPTSTPAVVVF